MKAIRLAGGFFVCFMYMGR